MVETQVTIVQLHYYIIIHVLKLIVIIQKYLFLYKNNYENKRQPREVINTLSNKCIKRIVLNKNP